MKKILSIVSAIAISTMASCGEVNVIKGNGVIAEKTIALSADYREVSAANGIKVILSPTLADRATMVADEVAMEYLSVTESGGTVKIFYKTNVNIRSKIETVVTLPMSGHISSLRVSSAAQLRAEKIETTEPITVSCSSAGSISTTIAAPSAEVKVSSAANCHIDIKSQVCDIEVSSASQFKGDVVADDLSVSVSSSAQYRGAVKAREVSVDVASASKCILTGECVSLDVDSASASQFDGEELQAAKVSVDAASASSVTVWATGELTVDLSSAGSVRYKGSPSLIANNVSGGASLKKID
jgi:hypothetical protein